jgi:hypothetical protein
LLETSGTKVDEVTGESSDLLIQYSGWLGELNDSEILPNKYSYLAMG